MSLQVTAPDGIPEVGSGDDLVGLLLEHLTLRDGDIVVITSKIVSKAEGRVFDGTGAGALAGESERVLARQGPITIVRSRLGITHATAGIDSSNVPSGTHALLPIDPDASARAIRRGVRQRTSVNIGILISDTAGRAWRLGQIDIAIGAAGVQLIEDFLGHEDGYGNRLAHTRPCVADELCSAAELAQRKTGRRPLAQLRGRADLVLVAGDDGAGATSLNRPEAEDLFGFGAREAVARAAGGDPIDAVAFGSAAAADDLRAALLPHCLSVSVPPESPEVHAVVEVDREALVAALAFAHGWHPLAPLTTDGAAPVHQDARQLRLVRVSP